MATKDAKSSGTGASTEQDAERARSTQIDTGGGDINLSVGATTLNTDEMNKEPDVDWTLWTKRGPAES
jgi:hypothetical protein